MTTLKKIVVWLTTSLLVLSALIIGLIGWIADHPQQAWKIAEKYFLPDDLKISWREMKFQRRHLAGLDFQIHLQIKGLLVQKEKPFLHFPVESILLKASIFPLNSKSKITMHDLQMISTQTLRLKLHKTKTKSEIQQNPFQQIQNSTGFIQKYMRMMRTENLKIEINDFELTSGEEPPFIFSLSAARPFGRQPDVIIFATEAKIPLKDQMRLQAEGELSLTRLGTDSAFIKTRINAVYGNFKTTQNLEMSSNQNFVSIISSGSANYRTGSTLITTTPSFKLRLTAREAEFSLASDITNLPGAWMNIRSLQVEIKSPLEKNILWSPQPSSFFISLPLDLFFVDQNMRLPFEKACQCRVPEVIAAKAEGAIWLAHFFTPPPHQAPVLDLDFKLEDVRNRLLSIKTTGGLRVEKKLHEYILSPHIDTRLKVHSFQGLKNFLDAKNILIPAPLNTLEGSVELRANGPLNFSSNGYIFPLWLSFQLFSEKQKIDIKTQSRLHFTSDFKKAQIDVNAQIAQLQLELPPLDPLKGRPRIIPDKRILKSPLAKKKGPLFEIAFSFQLKTGTPGSIHLLSEYFRPYAPLTLRMQKSADNRHSGFLRLEPFDIVYLRRKVHVEKLLLDLDEMDKGVLPVDGRLKIQQAPYSIFVDIDGPANRPYVRLTSDPYLPESEIISVLLYGRTSDQLATADAETAGSVQAAVADRAIGLFGLWIFASTPIKNFSYNPVTKVYAATIELSGDLTAEIGTDWEETTQVEVRKRISRRWALTATWTPATPDEEDLTELVLQWEQRF